MPDSRNLGCALPLTLTSYLQYLEFCSRIVRHSLKEPHRSAAIKRGEQGLKYAKWANGKQGENSKIPLLTLTNYGQNPSI